MKQAQATERKVLWPLKSKCCLEIICKEFRCNFLPGFSLELHGQGPPPQALVGVPDVRQPRARRPQRGQSLRFLRAPRRPDRDPGVHVTNTPLKQTGFDDPKSGWKQT